VGLSALRGDGDTMSLDEWVDEILDEYEQWQAVPEPKDSWRSHIKNLSQPPDCIKMCVPAAIQDAMVWFHDAGMSHGNIASILRIANSEVIRDALELLDAEYEDES
jgi:hypothetical protein